MASSPFTASTAHSSPPPAEAPNLDLSILPPMFVLPTHLAEEDLHELEDKLVEQGAQLTYDITEAKIVIGKVGTKRRAEMELRCRRLWTEEMAPVKDPPRRGMEGVEPPRKRQRVENVTEAIKPDQEAIVIDDSTTEDETESVVRRAPEPTEKKRSLPRTPSLEIPSTPDSKDVPVNAADFQDVVKVVKLEWLDDSSEAGRLLPFDNYVVYQGRPTARPEGVSTPTPAKTPPSKAKAARAPSQRIFADKPQQAQGILERAKADAEAAGPKHGLTHYGLAKNQGIRRLGDKNLPSTLRRADDTSAQKAALLQQTTSEYEGHTSDFPEPPDWVKQHLKYSCQRSTPPNPPNEPFITELKKIKLARLLTGDEIGVRAYSTSIASLAAYPYLLSHPREILNLPGCDTKIANLWIEWKNSGRIVAADEAEDDDAMTVLRLFYNIWGVGATTAREFYHDRGWRDLDDIVEYGWATLTRVQQIGVKFYDEFLTGIPRAEVELIGEIVREHAARVRDDDVEVTIVGGYRRGKLESGDVDMIVSHPDLDKTANLVTDIVASLETEGWITHTLLLSLTGTQRGQATLPFRASGGGGHGFDTLDKALVVWQDPVWPTRDADLAANPKAKNPSVHRRVDIIVSPWRTRGCAIAGWSGGTTFQRDLRRYAKNVKGWKFDSSGVRDRSSGEVVELEGPEGVEGTAEEAERTVFEGMGLPWFRPEERCTG
ncbi:hypothetical protein W97_03739 [Coniosporium apollinis CBS 100218]|uniref:DNA polymerase lambda n=1 Tax=Coniosporium apollinis (strain CBS 100218) TaxID=1168221 RepID=R7YS72_CONA1|nr:uncharacterized protein W97_03739 [Coniosporium apollinis CBS 100218]EON64506.1 hypothetical protein W97_03739 [Coniosporium apollinis CBS 100218]